MVVRFWLLCMLEPPVKVCTYVTCQRLAVCGASQMAMMEVEVPWWCMGGIYAVILLRLHIEQRVLADEIHQSAFTDNMELRKLNYI